MGDLVVDTFLTLDGVMQAPGAPREDPEGGFRHGGWQVPHFDAPSGKAIGEGIERMDALLLGRKTYDIFAAYWPTAPQDHPIAAKLNAVPKYVASRTLRSAAWRNSTILQGDAAQAIAEVKRRHRETHVIGSGNLVQTLLRHGLADRFNLWLYPVTLGQGKRLFAEGTVPTAFRLERSQAFPNGAVLLTYRPVGKPTYGDATLTPP